MFEKKRSSNEIFRDLIRRYPVLEVCKDEIHSAYILIKASYKAGNKLLVAGNGGSASDSEHIVSELMKSFLFPRKIPDRDEQEIVRIFSDEGKVLADHLNGSLPVIPLTSMPALSTAYSNDIAPVLTFAQMLYGYAKPGDVFLGISTSGNSKNIIYAMMVAKALKVKIIGLSGRNGGRLNELCDVIVHVPEEETFKIQELHLPIYHAVCAMLESDFFEVK